MESMIDCSCHCGAVRFSLEAAPASVNDCTCSICRRYGALWAYYPPSSVHFEEGSGPTDVYMRGEKDLEFHRCRACGCITHWKAAPKFASPTRMGVNARLAPPEALQDVQRLRNGKPSEPGAP